MEHPHLGTQRGCEEAMIAAGPGARATDGWGPQALDAIRAARREFQDNNAAHRDDWIRSNEYFYDGLKRVLQFIVEPGKRVLEVRCETGHILFSVMPAYGVGVEIGDAMVEYARQQHPDLHFVKSEPEDLDLQEKFDYIIFNHIFDTIDILSAFERLRQHCTSETKVIVVNYNHLWQPILQLASRFGLRSK